MDEPDLERATDLPPCLMEEEGIPEAVARARKALADPFVRGLMEARERAQRDEATCIDSARQEGRARERWDIARRMLEAGFDWKQIGEATGLSSDELDKLEHQGDR